MTARLASLCLLLVARTGLAQAPAPPRPALTIDMVVSIDGLARPTDDTTERGLSAALERMPDSDVDKSDLYFRLAELYAARHHAARLAGNANVAKLYLIKAVRVWKLLTDNDAFRSYPKLDTALFDFGYTLGSGAYMKEARTVYDRLIKTFPNSPHVPEAYLAFADYFFDQAQLADAEARYNAVLKFPRSPVYWYAMYRLGWVRMSLARHQEALEAFFAVVQATKADPQQVTLHREASRDFVRAYAEIGKPDKAYDAFRRVDPAAAQDMLELLADLELARGKLDAAAIGYRRLVQLDSTTANACRWQTGVVRAATGTADEPKAIDELLALGQCANHIDPELERGAARAALRTWEGSLPTDVKLVVPPRKSPIPGAIPPDEQRALTALARVVDGAAAELARMKLVTAVIYRKHHHHEEAIAILAEIVHHDADPDVAELAANLWLDSLLQLRRFDTALEVIDLLAESSFVAGKPQLKRNIEFLRSRSLR